jgi:hypothetical protein
VSRGGVQGGVAGRVAFEVIFRSGPGQPGGIGSFLAEQAVQIELVGHGERHHACRRMGAKQIAVVAKAGEGAKLRWTGRVIPPPDSPGFGFAKSDRGQSFVFA